MDKSGNGFISKNDWDDNVARITKYIDVNLSRTELAEMWKYMDSNGDRRIDYKEFLIGTDDDDADFQEKGRFPWGKLIKFLIAAYELYVALDDEYGNGR